MTQENTTTDPTDYTQECECGERNKVHGEGPCAICYPRSYLSAPIRHGRVMADIARSPKPDERAAA